MAKRFGTINPANGVSEVVGSIFGGLRKAPEGAALSIANVFVVQLSGDADVHGFQNPHSSDALVSVVVNVEATDAGETIDVGVAANGVTTSDTLMDGRSVATAGAFNTHGTNGADFRKLDKKGGLNDFVTWKASAGSDTLAGQIVITLLSLDK